MVDYFIMIDLRDMFLASSASISYRTVLAMLSILCQKYLIFSSHSNDDTFPKYRYRVPVLVVLFV